MSMLILKEIKENIKAKKNKNNRGKKKNSNRIKAAAMSNKRQEGIRSLWCCSTSYSAVL